MMISLIKDIRLNFEQKCRTIITLFNQIVIKDSKRYLENNFVTCKMVFQKKVLDVLTNLTKLPYINALYDYD